MSDLLSIASDAVTLGLALADPVSGPDGLRQAVAAARSLQTIAGGPGDIAPNLALLSPAQSVPRPPVDSGVAPEGPADLGEAPAGIPLAPPGPPGPPGDAGDQGPAGPPGPGIPPDRFAALEAAVAELQENQLTALAVGVQ